MIHHPETWQDALELKAAEPDAVPLMGGTDLMVELNFGRRRPGQVIDLSHVESLRGWDVDGEWVRIGAGLTYTRLIAEVGDRVPGLALASRTVGSPQIRNRGTVGGNLGAASPAGDSHPPLLAAGAEVEVESLRGVRRIPIDEFYVGPKRNALEPDELIAAVHLRAQSGPQQFSKIGTRNAMVISVCAFAVAIDGDRRRVGTGIGSAGPTPLRALEAEAFLTEVLNEREDWAFDAPLDLATRARFGELVASAARPIDDVRGTADYRRHALRVLAGRALDWVGN
ncbi:MAG: FAD binding domain-containing protein [Solirubrobacterales bacterium]